MENYAIVLLACAGFVFVVVLMKFCFGKKKEETVISVHEKPNYHRRSSDGDFMSYPPAASLPTVSYSNHHHHHHYGGGVGHDGGGCGGGGED